MPLLLSAGLIGSLLSSWPPTPAILLQLESNGMRGECKVAEAVAIEREWEAVMLIYYIYLTFILYWRKVGYKLKKINK